MSPWHYELLDEPVCCPLCGHPARAWLFFRLYGEWRVEEHWNNTTRMWCYLKYADPLWLILAMRLLRWMHDGRPQIWGLR